jgi:hypothetical protein
MPTTIIGTARCDFLHVGCGSQADILPLFTRWAALRRLGVVTVTANLPYSQNLKESIPIAIKFGLTDTIDREQVRRRARPQQHHFA